MDELLKSYEQEIVDLYESDKERDFECAHYIEKKIYKKYINDIADGTFKNLEDIKTMADLIKEKVIFYSCDKTRYFA